MDNGGTRGAVGRALTVAARMPYILCVLPFHVITTVE